MSHNSPSSVRRWIVRTALVLVVVVVLPLFLLWIFQRRLVFQPNTAHPGPADGYVTGASDVVLTTEDGLNLTAWYAPAAPTCDVTVLIAPGNAGNRAGRADLMGALVAEGFGVLLLEYRGYGGNPGSPSELGLRMDIEAAWQFLDRTADSSKLIYFGESLGGGPVTALALDHPPLATVLRSPFTDLAAAGQESYPIVPVRLLLKDRFPVQENVSRGATPLTVILGSEDSLIPPDQSRAVAAAGSGTRIEIDGANHNDPALVFGREVISAVVAAAGGRCR